MPRTAGLPGQCCLTASFLDWLTVDLIKQSEIKKIFYKIEYKVSLITMKKMKELIKGIATYFQYKDNNFGGLVNECFIHVKSYIYNYKYKALSIYPSLYFSLPLSYFLLCDNVVIS